MKKFHMLFVLVALFSLTGCMGTVHVAMEPQGKIDQNFQNIVKGKVHLYPTAQSQAIVKDKKGSTVIEQFWTPERKADPSYVTDVDLIQIFTVRSKQALQEAGYVVSYGIDAPADANLTIKENILGVFENPSTPFYNQGNIFTVYKFGFVGTSSIPIGEVYVELAFKDSKGAEKTVVVKGKGRSAAHLTRQSGFDRSMNYALDDFQKQLVLATKKELP